MDEEAEMRYEKGGNGDHLLIHLHCVLCHFRNIQVMNTKINIPYYERLIVIIWKLSLGAFWSQETGTVRINQTI